MDSQDPRKIDASGHESHGVHVCQKCGWPFPKPHPSAKHRRAHKRICGTVEGYKLIDSEENPNFTVSEDEQLSDEDHKTPSPTVVKRSNDEVGSGSMGDRSNRSEYEVFSDAVAEFSDPGPSPGIEGLLEGARESVCNEEKMPKDDSSTTQSIKDSAITEIIKPPNSSTDSSGMQNTEVPESMFNQLSSTLPQDHVPSSTISSMASSISDSGTKESACDVYPVKSGTSADAPQENKEANACEFVAKCSSQYIGMETGVKGNEVNNLVENLLDIAVSPSENAREASEVGPKLKETNGNVSDPMTAVGTVILKEEQSDGLGPKILPGDLSLEVESAVHTETFVDAAQVQVDTVQSLDFVNSGDIGDGCNTKGEENKNIHVLSVPDDIPVVDHPEIMIEDLKDHKAMKLNLPVTLDSCEAIGDNKDDIRDSFSEENCSSLQSRQSIEGIGFSPPDMHALEDQQEGGSSGPMAEKVSVLQQDDIHEIKSTIHENLLSVELGTPAAAERMEIEKSQTVCSPEEQEPQDFCNDLSKKILPENAATVVSNVNPVVSPMYGEVNETSNLVGGDDAGGHEKAETETGYLADNDCKEENHTENTTQTTNGSANNLCESQANQMTNLLGSDDVGDHERVKIKICDIAGNGSTDGSTGENLIVNSKTTPESSCSLPEFRVAEDGMVQSVSNLLEIESTRLDRVLDSSIVDIDVSHSMETNTNLKNFHDEDSQEVVEELEINSSKKEQVEYVGAVSTVAKSNHGGDIELLQKTSEDQLKKESLLLPVDAKSSVLDDEHTRVLGPGASESLQEEGDNNVGKQHLGVSMIDVSVDSSSQTDSLEGNWGSVSDATVLSMHSDAPVIVDAEALPATDSIASAKAEKAVLKKSKDASEGHSDKSDIFEPPSFMTLVEPRSGGDPRAAASEIQTVQNPEHKKPASLQAGWFPSITNVVNDSQGRKKNEEIIEKVTNWSTGKQHTPLKSLLGKANVETKPKSPNLRETPTPNPNPNPTPNPNLTPTPTPTPTPTTVVQKDGIPTKSNGALVTTGNSVTGLEAPVAQAAKGETGQEWNSPARYPADIKREKRKVKGKPYWVQFVCCSSVN